MTPALPRLRLSPIRRSRVRENGTPFFYLADTATPLRIRPRFLRSAD